MAADNGKVRDDGDRVKLDVKAGDAILFGKYSGQEIKREGMEYGGHLDAWYTTDGQVFERLARHRPIGSARNMGRHEHS
jgi:hypothetical protein